MPEDKEIIESALLVVRWQRGDRSAFEGIVKLWEKSLFYYLRRLAPSEAVAWELLQETWVKVLRSLKSLREPRALPAFLYRTARNAAITHLRRPELMELESDHFDPEMGGDAVVSFDDADEVHRALERLPLLQREALTLFFLQELTLEEMGTLLGVPVGTVKSRLHYAKQAIQKILSEGDDNAQRDLSQGPSERAGNFSGTPSGLSEGA